jgi:hypothetical protein
MRHISRPLVALVAVTICAQALAADQAVSSVMTSINIGPGQRAGEVSDVNGSIHIGANAVVGHVNDVNGSVHLDQTATAASLTTVNGSVHVGPGARVTDTVHTVNGSITLENGADVAGPLSAVNGSMTVTNGHVGGALSNVNGIIRILNSHIGGDIAGVNGGIEIGANSRIDGGVHVRRNEGNGWFNWWNFLFFSHTPPRIVIGPGAIVAGPLVFDQEVKLYVSDRARVGPIKGATAIRYSGEQPPD